MLYLKQNDNKSLKRKKEASQADRKKFKSNKYKPATQEELNQLQESSVNLTDSLLSLQIDNILKSFKLSTKYEKFIATWTENFAEFLNALPSETEWKSWTDIKWIDKKVMNPLDNEQFSLPKFNFQFLTPKSIRLTGAKLLTTIQSNNINVDIAVEIPKKCFQKGDYLNTIYHQKKALYLSYLAIKLTKWELKTNLEFMYDKLDVLRPILKITSNSEFKKLIVFHIHVIAEESTFKYSRFVPWNSNIRDGLFDGSETENADVSQTPHHNMSILRDLTIQANDNFLTETIQPHANLTKGISLFKLWLETRCLNENYCGFSGHIVSMFVAYLFKTRKLNISMSVFDVLRSIFLNLKFSKWHVKGISIQLSTTIAIEKFHSAYDVVFIDSTGWYNICSNLSLDIYLRTVEESSSALAFLDTKNLNNFRYLFIADMNPYFQFDHLFRVTTHADINQILQDHGTTANRNDYAGCWYPHILKLLSNVLRKGLDNRIHSLTPLSDKCISWSVTEPHPKIEKTISFGLKLNIENCFEILIKGPQANHDDAEEFKAFWGDKSEMRRFQDGSITESCIWAKPSDKLMKKRLITQDICLYLLNHHYNIKSAHINYMAGQFDLAYRLSSSVLTSKDDIDNCEHLTIAVIKSFDDLAKKLRSLDIELDVTSVLGSSAVFRYCEINPILPNATAFVKEQLKVFQSYRTNDGIIELASSGKWPDNIDAIQHVKAAFCLKIAKQLTEMFQLPSRGNVNSVEVVKDGFLFRLKLIVKKELGLIKEMPSKKGDVLPMEMDFLLPNLTVALHTLYGKNTCFGPAVLIAKRWLYSQMLDPFLWPDLCTELLMAYLFMEDKSYNQPIQSQMGFFRFLQLLRSTDWRSQLLILNFNEELKDTQIVEMENNFKSDRDSYPPLALITSYDSKKNSMWFKTAPSAEILARVAVLSNHAISLIEKAMFEKFSTKIFFKPSYDGYNVMIKLRKNLIRTSHVYDFFRNFTKPYFIEETVPAANFDPVQCLLHDLRTAYNDVAIFFYNPCGSGTIAVLWRPKIYTSVEFEVANINGRKCAGRHKYDYNLPQILEDFRIIGKGLVETVAECQ